MNIAVIGTGGVGGYFGGKLAKAGNNVTFVARGEHKKALIKNGLVVKSFMGDFHIPHPNVVDHIGALNQPDLIIPAVKAWQVRKTGTELKSVIHPESIILPMQNGILAANELAEEVERKHILGGLCRIISKIESPGIINHLAINPSITFGELDKTHTERLKKIHKLFHDAGIDSHISKDIEADLWKKFIGICVGGLLAVTRSDYGTLRSLPQTRLMMVELLNEIFILALNSGVTIKDDFVDKTMAAIDSFPPDSTTSLARDIWEGKPSELEYQNGTVVKLANKLNVDVPINSFIYNCILPMEIKSRKK